jgi:glucokinase
MYIIADIGGTNARMVLVSAADLRTESESRYTRTYLSQSISSMDALIVKFLEDAGYQDEILGLFCAIPGDVVGNEVEAMNLSHWGKISGPSIGRRLGIPIVRLLNDFEAVAYVLNSLTPTDIICIRRGTITMNSGLKVVIGLGTGLGVAFAVKSGEVWTPMSSETGFLPVWSQDGESGLLIEYLKQKHRTSTVAYEHICSGEGISNVYKFVCHQSGVTFTESLKASEIAERYATSAEARKTCDIVLNQLGRFLSLVCLMYKPTGGIYLTGGAMGSLASVISVNKTPLISGITSRDNSVLLDIALRPHIYVVQKENIGLVGIRSFALLNSECT